MKKVLIIGANGQLAFDLIKIFKGDYEIIRADREDFDVSDWSAASRFMAIARPNIVINTAAFHKTEECEFNPQKSFEVNTIGALNTAKAAAAVNAKIVFISTDYVFDGNKKNFSEDDKPNPLNVYGTSKLAGELLTRIANQDYFIIRTCWLYGAHSSGKGYNFVSLMLEKARSGENIKVVGDQFGSPTYTYDLALKIKELIDKNAPSGIYHITNSGSCSWYEFAKKIFEIVNINTNLEAVDSNAKPSNIKRPRYSVLISSKLADLGISKLRPWSSALSDFLTVYK
jgi:dTDP-4-dehydrorhamnose reductase